MVKIGCGGIGICIIWNLDDVIGWMDGQNGKYVFG